VKAPKKLLNFLLKGKNFLIATHINPEGDALGSSVALSMALEFLGKKTFVYCKDPVPEFYKFLPKHKKVSTSLPNSKQLPPLVLVDCNTIERAGLEETTLQPSAIIDHHEPGENLCDVKWIEPKASAAGILVYHVIKDLGVKITKAIATNLYTAIAVDTGIFRHNNTNSEAMGIASELIAAGADPYMIAENLYETWSENRFKLMLKVLATTEIYNSTAITKVTLNMFEETGSNPADTENFINFTQMMESIKISALFRELGKNSFKVSLRSKKETVNVAKIAEMFGGGGHKNAAGYKANSDFNTAKQKLLNILRRQ
jgi:phosphoesterase RecJ-like protein